MDSIELTPDELRELRALGRAVDDLLEESLRAKENLEQTFRRLFPPLLAWVGARGVAVTTLDEELKSTTFHHGELGGVSPATSLAAARWGVQLVEGGLTLVAQALDLVGQQVGSIGLYFEGDRTKDAARLARLLDTIAEELDTVLASVQTAVEKHQLLVAINHSLADRVFEVGMDGAVRALCERVRLPGFALLYRDAIDGQTLHYRLYRHGQLDYASNGRRSPELDAAIRQHGAHLVQLDDPHLGEVLGDRRVMETVLISGWVKADALGKITVWNGGSGGGEGNGGSGGEGFSANAMDLVRLLASTLTQRLIDYNRERIHLAQFFSSGTIDELLKDPEYERRYLAPRAEEVGILFADINGFTRICEQVLERPERIGTLIDDWSVEVVRILHRFGGVFDKMVGDCIIGLWGPPFFKDSRGHRAAGAVGAAIEIQRFTREEMSAHPALSRLGEVLKMPGLGVAVGVNLAHSSCGLFGPNRNYTAFSTGVNQTARLQALGGFRETLVMESVARALAEEPDPQLAALELGPLEETPVKNIAQPLRYHRATLKTRAFGASTDP